MCKDGLKNLSSASVLKYPHCSPDHFMFLLLFASHSIWSHLNPFPHKELPILSVQLLCLTYRSLSIHHFKCHDVFIIPILTDSLTIYSNVQGELVTDRLKSWDCGREASLSWCLRTEMLLSAVVLLLCFCISLSIQTWSLFFICYQRSDLGTMRLLRCQRLWFLF